MIIVGLQKAYVREMAAELRVIIWCVILLEYVVSCGLARRLGEQQPGFDQNYQVTWGGNHVSYPDGGREIQLSLDKNSGSGFASKDEYYSGMFRFKIKIPGGDSAGVVTAFYLSSRSSNHDELDFEFLGNRPGKPITLQTNVFANGHGNREQRVNLWFDPSADFHEYKILWNPYQIVFFVDDIPIRIFEKKSNMGANYPSQPMQIISSLWNGDDWATNGGKAKINWSQAPFTASFQGFGVDGCSSSGGSKCYTSNLWWNVGRYKELTPAQKAAYENVKRRYMTYDYCTDRQRYPSPPPECQQ